MLCGDVEVNPGPTKLEIMVEQILEGQKCITNDVKQIKDKQNQFQTSVDEMSGRIARLENSLVTIKKNEEAITVLHSSVNELRRTVTNQQAALTNLEDRSRKNNMIIFGVPEPDNETNDDVRSKVLEELFRGRLGVTVQTAERINRLGKKREQRSRPIIMKFRDYNEKIEVFKNCHKLKGSSVSLQNDFCQETLRKRKQLWDSAETERATGRRVKLFEDKLQIGSDLYFWDNEASCRTKITKDRHAPVVNK